MPLAFISRLPKSKVLSAQRVSDVTGARVTLVFARAATPEPAPLRRNRLPRCAPRDDPRASRTPRAAYHRDPKMADFATTEEPRSEDEDEPMEDDNDFLDDAAPAASHEPPPQVKQTQPSPVSVANVAPLKNPANFGDDLDFEITFESTRALPGDLEWSVVYVGSADDSARDQTLADVEVGPVPAGTSRFVLSADAPDPAKIPAADLLGVTVVLVCCAYKGQEFLRIGYYVNNEAPEGEAPSKANVTRTLLAEQPRVTRVDIDWGEA